MSTGVGATSPVPLPFSFSTCALLFYLAAVHGSPTQFSPMQRTILVVDDSQEFSIIVEIALRQQLNDGEYMLLFANSGEQALQTIEEHPEIALVITDISMPGMDGLTLLERMNEHNPHIKSIVISGYNDMSYIRRAMNAGASDYLVKPVSLHDLEESVMHTMMHVDIVRDALKSRDRLMQLERDLVIAGEIQRAMLPQKYPAFPDRSEFDITAGMTPAREVGGDFYDFFLIDGEYLGFLIGDVTGKGIPAALLMALTRTLIRSYALQGKPVNEILSLVNNALATDNRLAMFSTCFLGIMELKTGTVEYCNAAHSQPFVILPNTDVYVLDTRGGMALGMLENMTYRVSTITMQPGMTLVLYTDGITDATNIRREMYGTERIGLTLASNAALAPQELMMALLSSVDQFVAGEEQADDIGIVILRYTGSTTP